MCSSAKLAPDPPYFIPLAWDDPHTSTSVRMVFVPAASRRKLLQPIRSHSRGRCIGIYRELVRLRGRRGAGRDGTAPLSSGLLLERKRRPRGHGVLLGGGVLGGVQLGVQQLGAKDEEAVQYTCRTFKSTNSCPTHAACAACPHQAGRPARGKGPLHKEAGFPCERISSSLAGMPRMHKACVAGRGLCSIQ